MEDGSDDNDEFSRAFWHMDQIIELRWYDLSRGFNWGRSLIYETILSTNQTQNTTRSLYLVKNSII